MNVVGDLDTTEAEDQGIGDSHNNPNIGDFSILSARR